MPFSPDSLLWYPVLIQAAMFVLFSGALLGRAAWLPKAYLRLSGKREIAHEGLIHYLNDSKSNGESALKALQELPVGEQLALLVGLTSQLGGSEQERLMELAQGLGLLEAATAACGSQSWWERLHGVRTLLLLGAYERIPMVLVKDDHALVRADAVRRWTDRPAEGIPHLLRLLDDPSPVGRFAVQDALLRMGGTVAEPLADYLADSKSVGLEAALEVAARLADPGHNEVARQLSRAESAPIRARAATLLGALGGKEGAARLLEMLADPDSGVKQASLKALGRLGEWSVAPQVAAVLGDDDWYVRRAAALALLSLGSAGQLFLSKISREGTEAGTMARYALSLPESSREAAL